jgi:hypothetical protein
LRRHAAPPAAGKLGRSEVLMRQKVSYLERVNAELAELLDK